MELSAAWLLLKISMPAMYSALLGAGAPAIFTKQTSLKQVKIWRNASAIKDPKIVRAVEKYKKKGFKFLDAGCSGIKIRSLNDEDALLIEYGKMYR